MSSLPDERNRRAFPRLEAALAVDFANTPKANITKMEQNTTQSTPQRQTMMTRSPYTTQANNKINKQTNKQERKKKKKKKKEKTFLEWMEQINKSIDVPFLFNG